jgi:hypothetical protein
MEELALTFIYNNYTVLLKIPSNTIVDIGSEMRYL